MRIHAQVRVGDSRVAEGDGMASVAVILDRPLLASGVSIRLQTRSRSASGVADYQDTVQWITFDFGTVPKNVQVQIVDDATLESDEVFIVRVLVPKSARNKVRVARRNGHVILVDDD